MRSLDVGGALSAADVHAVAVADRPVHVGADARARMRASSACLARYAAEGRLVYGVTTGFGPLAGHRIPAEHAAALQHNLLRHLAAGVGPPLPRAQVRALMTARAACLARGWSGIGEETFDLLLACLNRGVTPVVPEKGTVGASGDLTPLAHVALVLVGEGRAMLADGRVLPGAQALATAGLAPVSLGIKEGLALVNGTSAMTGIAALNAERARRAAALMARLAVLHAEVLGGRAEAWDARFGLARPHPGQQRAHAELEAIARGGRRLVRATPSQDTGEALARGESHQAAALPQDPYTIRCVPQVLGAILDVLAFHAGIVECELASATDNPIVAPPGAARDDEGAVLHGGNFYGQHVAFASDALYTAVVKMAAWGERALARVCNPLLSGGLPPFLHGGLAGLNSGFMGAQVTATALVAELRTRAVPASIQTIPTNNDNQDIVSMGTIAARKASDALDMTWQVLAILALALAQAATLRAGATGEAALDAAGFAPASLALVALVRSQSAPLDDDRALSDDIERVALQLERWSALAAPGGADA